MSRLPLPEVDLYYETHGDGPAIVFIHGGGGDHLVWWRQPAALMASAKVVLYDQRGFGASRPKGPHDAGDARALTRDLAALLDHLELEKAVIVGHSLGTLPALDYAEAHPERVRGLVLSSAYGGLSSPALADAIAARAALFRGPPPAPAGPSTPRSPDEAGPFGMAEAAHGPFSAATRAGRPDLVFLYGAISALAGSPKLSEIAGVFETVRPITTEQARALPWPVMIIGGSEDPVFPPHELQAAASCFERSKTVIVPEAGHSAYFEQADRFNAELKAFLETCDG